MLAIYFLRWDIQRGARQRFAKLRKQRRSEKRRGKPGLPGWMFNKQTINNQRPGRCWRRDHGGFCRGRDRGWDEQVLAWKSIGQVPRRRKPRCLFDSKILHFSQKSLSFFVDISGAESPGEPPPLTRCFDIFLHILCWLFAISPSSNHVSTWYFKEDKLQYNLETLQKSISPSFGKFESLPTTLSSILFEGKFSCFQQMSSDPIQIRSSSWLTKNFSLLPNLLFQSSTFVMGGGLVCKTMYLAKPSQQPRCWHDKLFAKTHYYTKKLINFFDKFVSAESLLGFDIHPITSSCIATLLPLNPTFDPIPIWLESDNVNWCGKQVSQIQFQIYKSKCPKKVE